MSWTPYFFGTRIERQMPLRETSVKVFLERASEALQERGFVEVRSEEGCVVLNAPGGLSRILNTMIPGSHGVLLRARQVEPDTIHFSYDARHLREVILFACGSLMILFSDLRSTILLAIPLFLGLAWLLPYFFHIDHFHRIVNGPRDIFKHLRHRS